MRRVPIRFALAVCAAVTMVALSSCDGTGNAAHPPARSSPMHVLTQSEAVARAEDYLHAALRLLPPGARTDPMYSPDSPCTDALDRNPTGRSEVGRDYWIRNLDYAAKKKYVETVRRYWRENDFEILDDGQQRGDFFVSAQQRFDGFRMSVEGGISGDMSIGASSPCVPPDGSPPPGGVE